MKKVTLLLLFLLPITAFSQGEASWWFFGQNASLDFNSGAPVAGPNGSLNTFEGCSTISNKCGDLLMYSDGSDVWDSTGARMPNGFNLSGNSSSAQSAIIIPDLNNPNIYFVVTIGTGTLEYSLVDISLNGGLGDVVAGRKNIRLQTGTQEKVTATLSDNGNFYWIVSFLIDNNGNSIYRAWQAGGGNVNTNPAAVISSNIPVTSILTDQRGYIRLSPDGSRIVNTSVGDGAFICDFDNATGIVSNPIQLNSSVTNVNSFYGSEFSPNSQILYLDANSSTAGNFCTASNRAILQYDLNAANFQNNAVAIHTAPTNGELRGALQLGIDGQVYVARNCEPWLGTIRNPNTIGAGSGYVNDGVALLAGTQSREGLPPFISSFFEPSFLSSDANAGGGGGNNNNETEFCDGTPVQFDSSASGLCATATVNWDFGDGNGSTMLNPVHTYAGPGVYTVTLTVTSGAFSSSAVDDITIYEVPVGNPVTDPVLCDDMNNGSVDYDLTVLETPQVIGAQTNPNFVVSYFLTQVAADNNTGAITLPFPFPVGVNTVFARITNNESTASQRCFDTISFDVIVVNTCTPGTPEDLEVCDDDNDGFSIFDLTTTEAEILGGLPAADNDITFHETAADATNGVNEILNPATYVNLTNPQTIYVRLFNIPTSQASFVDFDLIVYDTPTANAVVKEDVCDDATNDGVEDVTLAQFDTEVLGAQLAADNTVTYYATQADADAPTNPLGAVLSVNSGVTTIYARIGNNASTDTCFDTVAIDIELFVTPQAAVLDVFRLCDDVSNNNSENFDLSTRDALVLNGLSATDFTVDYFISQADADLGTGGGASPLMQNYSSAGQTVFVRVENNANRSCFSTTTLDLIVDDLPVASAPISLSRCDIANDGSEDILLSDFDGAVLNGQNNTSFVTTYHPTQNDADNDTAALGTTLTVTGGLTTIYARVDNSDNETCAAVTQIDIQVDPQAVANATTEIRLCDDASNDGVEDFNLDSQTADVLGAQNAADFNVEYFTSQADADLGSVGGATPLASPYNSGNATIFVRIETVANPSCAATDSFDIFVDPTPVANAPANVELCDDASNNGTEEVDLTQYDTQVLNGQTTTTFVVTYHPTQNDADNDTNALSSPYTVNIGVNTVWVRVDNSDNETCNNVTSFNITLFDLPVANVAADYRICDDISDDGVEDFDLTLVDNDVIGTQNPADFTIEYFTTLADANLGTTGGATALATPYNSGNTTLFIRIENNANDACISTTTVDLFVDPTPIIGTPADIIVCDDPSNDGVEDVDLSQFDTTILAGQTNTSFVVSYHATQADADNDVNPLSSPYTVDANTPALFARIDNSDNETCDVTTTFNFVISPTPTANPVADMISCDDDSNDGSEIFDLSMANSEVLLGQNPADFNITFHPTQNDADNNTAALPINYASTTTTPETIFVRIESATNAQCADFTNFDIIVSVQPIAGIANDIVGCDDVSNDGVEDFDFTSQDADILNGQAAGSFNITYHVSQADADNDVNALNSPYQNTSLAQTIYARIENTSNEDCFDTSSFDIEVFERPIIADQGPITICAGVDEVLDAGAGYTSYLWSTGETTQTITVNTGDDYTVTVTNADGCDSTATITVIESDVATIVRIDIQQFVVNTNQLTAIVTGSGDYEYSLDDFVYQDSPRFGNLYPGYYTIYVRDKNGCGTVQLDAVIIGGPAYFTPNQDGFHDTWQLIAVEEIPDAKIYIFDRYGKLLKQISPNGIGWDGTFNGNPMPSSDYWYMVELTDGNSFRGHFALKR